MPTSLILPKPIAVAQPTKLSKPEHVPTEQTAIKVQVAMPSIPVDTVQPAKKNYTMFYGSIMG